MRLALILLPLILLPLILGCANPGALQPPSVHVPEAARQVVAERTGDTVTISWLPPRRAADGGSLRGITTATLCRAEATGPCLVIATLQLPAAATTAHGAAGKDSDAAKDSAAAKNVATARPASVSQMDPLPPALIAGAPRLLCYRVELRNGRGISVGPSAAACTAAGPPPPPVGHFSATGARDGVALRWQPLPRSEGRVEVTRTTEAVPADHDQPTRAPGANETIHLRADGDVADAVARTAAAGMLDISAKPGAAYVYVAERVRTVTLAGHTMTLRSEATRAAPLVLMASYAPPPPAGLLAVPEYAATTGDTASVELSWQPEMTSGVAGYNIYRSLPDGTALKLTPQPVAQASFRDTAPPAGTSRWSYMVTAVNAAGLESTRSTATDVER